MRYRLGFYSQWTQSPRSAQQTQPASHSVSPTRSAEMSALRRAHGQCRGHITNNDYDSEKPKRRACHRLSGVCVTCVFYLTRTRVFQPNK